MLAVVAMLVIPAVGEGQATPPTIRNLAPAPKKTVEHEGVPESHLPPPGMCRIWINNVPPVQQPAPTDCASAIKNRPSNGRVIFPEDGAKGGRPAREKGEKSKDGRRDKDEKSGRDAKESKPGRP
jgi:hypothetical protein